jgi:hypothetical protein
MDDSNGRRWKHRPHLFCCCMRRCVDDCARANVSAKDGHCPVDHIRTGSRISQCPCVVDRDDSGDASWRNDVVRPVNDACGSNEPVHDRVVPVRPHSHCHGGRVREATRARTERGAPADEIRNHTDFVGSHREFVKNSLDGPSHPRHRTVEWAGIDGNRDHRAQRRWTNRSMGFRRRFKEQ